MSLSLSSGIAARLSLPVLLLTLAVLPSRFLEAQQPPAAARIPAKDIAILVDVSRSTAKDGMGHEMARRIIVSLCRGEPFDPAQFPGWVLDPAPREWDQLGVSQEMQTLFGRYLGDGASGDYEPVPLTGPGNDLFVSKIGTLATVLDTGVPIARIRSLDHFSRLTEERYPRSYRDGSTCYWYAMAHTASSLGVTERGYYLFVVSDENDDPNYIKHDTPGRDDDDYRQYLRDWADEYPYSLIKSTIDQYFTPVPVPKGQRPLYKGSDRHPQALIARFRQTDESRDKPQVRLAWYAMGVKPEPVPLAAPESKPVPKNIDKPALAAHIELLGGLSPSVPKVFRYKDPVIVWQVAHGEATGDASATFRVEKLSDGGQPRRVRSVTGGSPRIKGPLTAVLKDLPPGEHRLRIVLEDSDRVEAMTSDPVTIRIEPRDAWLLPLLAILSALTSISIFVWIWLSLRARPLAVTRTAG